MMAVFTLAHWQLIANIAVHIDLEDPVANLVTLALTHQVLLWQDNVVWRWDVCALEVGIISDRVGIGVLNRIVQVDVSIVEDEGGIVMLDFLVEFTSIQECLISSNDLAIAKQGGGNSGLNSVKTVP